MKRKSPYKIVRALTLIFALGLLTMSPFSTASTQKPVDPACVVICNDVMLDCMFEIGHVHKCLARYKVCIAQCR